MAKAESLRDLAEQDADHLTTGRALHAGEIIHMVFMGVFWTAIGMVAGRGVHQV